MAMTTARVRCSTPERTWPPTTTLRWGPARPAPEGPGPHRLPGQGGDVFSGSPPPRLQPMETYQGRPIFYGLGNFVWPNTSLAGSTTAVAQVTVSGSGTFSGRLVPAFIQAAGHPVISGS